MILSKLGTLAAALGLAAALAAPAAAAPLAVRGRVLDEAGRGLPGAEVRLEARAGAYERGLAWLAGERQPRVTAEKRRPTRTSRPLR